MQLTSAFENWLQTHFGAEISLAPLTGDASARKYFRVLAQDKQVIAVDASAELSMNQQFYEVSEIFRANQINVPTVHCHDLKSGYLVIDDFGDTLYQEAITEENVDKLYKSALDALVQIQAIDASQLPRYSEQMLASESRLFVEWYLAKELDITLSETHLTLFNQSLDVLIQSALEQPFVCVHRDYHCRNLFLLGEHNPGIIDYQDAVLGPITYDPVSLLKDCYINWPEDKVHNWLNYFYQQIPDATKNFSLAQLTKWFDFMGVQRHLKAIGIFARLNQRDHNPNYLNDIPRTLQYVRTVAEEYPELDDLQTFLNSIPGLPA